MRKLTIAVFALVACACNSPDKKAADRLKELEQKHAEAKAKQEKLEAAKTAAPAIVEVPSPYNDRESEVVTLDGKCPEGLWAFFNDTPGATPEDKKANAARRADLLTALKGKQFLVKLRAPQVTVGAFDAPTGQIPFTVAGTIDCKDEQGRIALAWTEAKALPGDPELAKQGGTVMNEWQAKPIAFGMPMTMNGVKEFETKHKLGVTARVVFKLLKGDVDAKKIKVAKVEEKVDGEKLGYGGGYEDWGAGRVIRAQLVGVRVATDGEKSQLYEQKP